MIYLMIINIIIVEIVKKIKINTFVLIVIKIFAKNVLKTVMMIIHIKI